MVVKEKPAPVSEADQIRATLTSYEARLGYRFNVLEVKGKNGDGIGYILERTDRKPKKRANWYLFDVDDTLIATNRIKDMRTASYNDYLLSLSDQVFDVEEIMSSTYDEARVEGIYSAGRHVQILSDRTVNLIGGKDINVKNEIEEIFDKTLTEIPAYPGMLESVASFAGEKDNVGFMTLGEPVEQTVKIGELLSANPGLPVDQIFVTKVAKDVFIERLVELKKEADDSPFGFFPHTVVSVDDSILSLEKQRQAKWPAGVRLVLVRARRGETKDGKDDWIRGFEMDLQDDESESSITSFLQDAMAMGGQVRRKVA